MLPSACLDGVGTPDDIHFRAQYPAYACPCHRSTPSLTADGVWLRVGVVRYTFPVRLFHPLHSSRLLALSNGIDPLGSRPGYALQWALIQDVFNGDERSEVIAEVAEAFGEALASRLEAAEPPAHQ